MLVPCGSELPNRAVPRPQTETPLPAPRLDPWHRGGTEQAEEPPPQCPGRCRPGTAGRTPEDVTVSTPPALDTRAGVQPCAKCIYHALLGPSPAPSPARCPLGHTLGYSSTPHLPLCATPGWVLASREGQAAMVWEPRGHGTQGQEGLHSMGDIPQANLVALLAHPLTKAASSSSWLCQVHGTRPGQHTLSSVLPGCPTSPQGPLLLSGQGMCDTSWLWHSPLPC